MLVSFHVAGAGPDVGLNLPETHDVQRVNLVLSYLRMPLFSFLSGYVYAHRPFRGQAIPFLRGKVIRLLLPRLLAGVSSAFLLLRSGWRSSTLDYVGGYSFAIYLLHVFFTARSRITLNHLHITNTYALLLLGTTWGIVGPIVAASVIGRSARWSRWLLGSSTTTRSSPVRAMNEDVTVKTKIH